MIDFDDHRVQVVYDILCSEESPPEGEHWEGFVATKIVKALFPENNIIPHMKDEYFRRF